MRRGFKTWCENISSRYRDELKISRTAPLNAKYFASYLKIPILSPEAISNLSEDSKRILLIEDPNSWSALTLCKGEKHIIIYNSTKSPGRTSSDIMHELSHIIIGHEGQKNLYSHELNVMLRHFNAEQEDEANCLAGILLLPKDALWSIKNRNLSNEQASEEYCVSKQLLNMRLNLSGVNIVHKRIAYRS